MPYLSSRTLSALTSPLSTESSCCFQTSTPHPQPPYDSHLPRHTQSKHTHVHSIRLLRRHVIPLELTLLHFLNAVFAFNQQSLLIRHIATCHHASERASRCWCRCSTCRDWSLTGSAVQVPCALWVSSVSIQQSQHKYCALCAVNRKKSNKP